MRRQRGKRRAAPATLPDLPNTGAVDVVLRWVLRDAPPTPEMHERLKALLTEYPEKMRVLNVIIGIEYSAILVEGMKELRRLMLDIRRKAPYSSTRTLIAMAGALTDLVGTGTERLSEMAGMRDLTRDALEALLREAGKAGSGGRDPLAEAKPETRERIRQWVVEKVQEAEKAGGGIKLE